MCNTVDLAAVYLFITFAIEKKCISHSPGELRQLERKSINICPYRAKDVLMWLLIRFFLSVATKYRGESEWKNRFMDLSMEILVHTYQKIYWFFFRRKLMLKHYEVILGKDNNLGFKYGKNQSISLYLQSFSQTGVMKCVNVFFYSIFCFRITFRFYPMLIISP